MDPVDRRDFIKTAAGTAAFAALDASGRAMAPNSGPVLISTWVTGKPANERAAEILKNGGTLLDAVEKGINLNEDDPNTTSAGIGGLPNAVGEVELDAAIMDGTRHRAGSVCGLRLMRNPISVARQVLEKTFHTTLAGEGAFLFALKMGFEPQCLLTADSLKQWQEWKADPHRKTYWVSIDHHDTIGMLGTDGTGRIVAGTSTAGLPFKIPGRVADSALVGCGLYADDNVGAAAGTGDGDLMTNYCTSMAIVNLMAHGASPQDACMELLRHMVKTDPKTQQAEVGVIALNKQGKVGAGSGTV